jgi:molybdopterin-guanine dinucleotide biosynthesis protein A
MLRPDSIAGVILAGGRSSRMKGPNKIHVKLAGKTLLARAIARLEPQVDTLAINSNSVLPNCAFPVIVDPIDGYAGPLAGILAAMQWAKTRNAALVATIACDTPFFPSTLVERLQQQQDGNRGIALATSGGRVHPVFGLWPVELADTLEEYLQSGARRSVLAFAEQLGYAQADFPVDDFDPFFNINMPADLAESEKLAQKLAL